MNNSKKCFSDNFGRKNIENLKNNRPFSDNSNDKLTVLRPSEKSGIYLNLIRRRRPTIKK